MTSNLTIVPILYLLGAAHGAFLAAALYLSKSGPKRANVYLGLYTLVFVLSLLAYFFDSSGLTQPFFFVKVLLWPKEFLYGVLIYFYTRELTQPGEYPLKAKQWWHFAPALIHILLTWPLALMPESTQLAVLGDAEPNTSLETYWALLLGDIEQVFAVLHITLYLLLSLRLLREHRHHLLSSVSNLEKVSLDWLRYLLIGTLVVYFCWLGDELLELEEPLSDLFDTLLGLSMVALIYSMSILGLRQSNIFAMAKEASVASSNDAESNTATDEAPLPQIDNIKALEAEEKQKYRHSSLTDEMCEQLMAELEAHMTTAKPYRDSNLSLPKLAANLGVSNNYLSQVINQQAEQNFFDFVNRYRIADVQALIRDNTEATILDLALSSGFNSKSAFYNAFRKHTGQTPSQFKKSL